MLNTFELDRLSVSRSQNFFPTLFSLLIYSLHLSRNFNFSPVNFNPSFLAQVTSYFHPTLALFMFALSCNALTRHCKKQRFKWKRKRFWKAEDENRTDKHQPRLGSGDDERKKITLHLSILCCCFFIRCLYRIKRRVNTLESGSREKRKIIMMESN